MFKKEIGYKCHMNARHSFQNDIWFPDRGLLVKNGLEEASVPRKQPRGKCVPHTDERGVNGMLSLFHFHLLSLELREYMAVGLTSPRLLLSPMAKLSTLLLHIVTRQP